MAAVVVPYVEGMLHDETRRAVLAAGWVTTWHCIDPGDPGAYARLIERLWGHQETFVVVEQDVVPPAGAIGELIDCPHLWCSHCYDDLSYQRVPMLGLAKFCGDLLTGTAEVAATVLRDSARHQELVHWRQLNERLVAHLGARGIHWHRHIPDAAHHHREPRAPG